jgi:hypothetical protein
MNKLHGEQNIRINTLRSRFLIAMDYVVFCYQKIDTTYEKSKFIANSKHNRFEDFLKFKLIDDFLNQDIYTRSFEKTLVKTLDFQGETIKVFNDNTRTSGDNKNDIFVLVKPVNTAKGWEEDDDEIIDTRGILGKIATQNTVWFQIECKILDGNKRQNDTYIDDIEKFCERSYKYEYQPFGGMIAFVNKSGFVNKAADSINHLLPNHINITTLQPLQSFPIRTGFDYSYQSIHQHRLGHNVDLYHLLLNYSAIIKP